MVGVRICWFRRHSLLFMNPTFKFLIVLGSFQRYLIIEDQLQSCMCPSRCFERRNRDGQ
jgi:hypothetical protein